jgi:hypothetical protein
VKNAAKYGILLILGVLISLRASARKNFAMINVGSRTRKAINVGGTTYFTNYSLLPIVPNEWTQISISDTIKAIKAQNLPESFGKAVFALILSEAAKIKGKAIFRGLNNNYAGVQTDSGVWGFANFEAQTARIDSGGDARMFAVFADFQDFMEFLINRAKAKGFDKAATDVAWADTYIRKWWGRTPTPSTLRSKASIYRTAINYWQNN